MKTLTTLIAVFVIGTSAAQFENATNSKYRLPDISKGYISVEDYIAYFNYRIIKIDGNTVYTRNADVKGCTVKEFKGEHPSDIKVGDVISLRIDGRWKNKYDYSKDVEYIIKKEEFEDYLVYIRSL